MPSVQISTRLSTDDRLMAIEQLNSSELEDFTSRIIRLRAKRIAPQASKDEAALLKKINHGIPLSTQERYDELVIKRDAETSTDPEYNELLQLTDQIEKVDAERLGNLAELARIRQTSLDDLMEELGIKSFPSRF